MATKSLWCATITRVPTSRTPQVIVAHHEASVANFLVQLKAVQAESLIDPDVVKSGHVVTVMADLLGRGHYQPLI